MRNPIPAYARALALFLLVLGPIASAREIPVSGVEQLYREINTPANAGNTLILSRGEYRLSANDPSGAPRANGGRIHLLRDMSIRGVKGDASAVIITAIDLPMGSFPPNVPALGPSAAVRMGLGRNSLDWLTVRDAKLAQANIDVGLQALDPGTAVVRISHVLSTGSVRGLNALNFGASASGQTLEIEISDSDFYDNNVGTGVTQGIRIGNFQGSLGSNVNAVMTRVRCWGQKQGRLIVNNLTSTSSIRVNSTGGQFYGNGAGTIVIGGLSSAARADNNAITFDSRAEKYISNGATPEFDRGGLLVLGGEDISSGGGASGNTVTVALRSATTLGNVTADLYGVGARTLSAAAAVNNQGNRVSMQITGDGNGKATPIEFFRDSLPETPNYGNFVTVVRD